MSKADLFFRPADVVISPDGRTMRYWGKYLAKKRNETKAIYVFFDTVTDRCVELQSTQALSLHRVKTSR